MNPHTITYLDRQRLDCDTFQSIGYDPAEQILQLEFKKDKRVYNYYQIPPMIHSDLMAAPLKGRYFHLHIAYHFDFEEMHRWHQVG